MSGAFNKLRKTITTKEVLAVIVVTMLIWLYAEAESVATTNADTFVRLAVPEGADRLVNNTDPSWSGAITIRLQGARGAIDSVKSSLARGIDLASGAGGVPGQPGRHTIDLRSVIQATVMDEHKGVVVASVDPPTMSIEIEAIETLSDIPVVAVFPDGLRFASDPVIEPATVSIVGSSSAMRALTAAGEALNARVVPAPDMLVNLVEGVSRTFTIPVTLADNLKTDSKLSITPAKVTVTVRVQSQFGETTIPSAPIWVWGPQTELDRWVISIEPQFLSDVKITGPADLIQSVESGDLRVIGAVELTSSILEAGGGAIEVNFPDLPDSLSVEMESTSVTVTATPREQDLSAAQP